MALGINIGGGLSGAGTGAAIGSAIPGIGTAAGAIAGGILGLFGGSGGNSYKDQKKLMSQAWEYEKEGMGLQYEYNNKMGDENQRRAQELWDYTNVENQRKHLENAGLSVGLMYGNGGTMQASSAGGQGQGVQGMKANPVEIAIQNKALGIQMRQVESQTALNAASAAKQMAEAEKLKGVDTDAVKASIDNIIAQTHNEEAKNGLIYAQKRAAEIEADLNNANIEEIGWNIKYIEKNLNMIDENITAAKINNEIAKATKANQIEMAQLNVLNAMKDAILKESQSKLTEEQAKAIVAQIAQGWEGLNIQKGGQTLQKTIAEWTNEREYTIGREKIDNQRMSSAVGVMTKAGEVFGRMWKKLGDKIF